MLSRLIDQGVENRLLVVLVLLATVVGATLTVPSLNLDAFPDVTNVQVVVNTEAPGLAAEEVEQLITYPIEAVMYALPDVEEVRSISKTGLSVITVVFEEGTDIYFARQLVFECLQAAREQIPEGVGVPELGPNTSGLGQVFQYVLKTSDAERYDAMRLRSLNDWVVKLLLMPVEGITDVLSFGGDVLQNQVQIDPSQLLAYALTLNEVVEAIEANNRNAGGWYLDRGAEQLVVRGVGWVRSGAEGLRDIGNIPVKDVDAVKDRLPIIQQALPEGVSLEPIYDQADLVAKAVATVTRALVEAFVLILIFLLLYFAFHSVGQALLIMLNVPLALIGGVGALFLSGQYLSVPGAIGFIALFGVAVLNGVVMVNAINQLLEGGQDPDQAVFEGALSRLRPVLMTASIAALGLIPMLLANGVGAEVQRPLATVVVGGLFSSTILTLFVLPAVYPVFSRSRMV